MNIYLIKLLDVLSQWLWPITVLIVVLLFRKDISIFLKRLRKGTILGNEIELEPYMNQLRKDIDEVQEETLVDTYIENRNEEEANILDKEISQVIEVSKDNLELAIIRLSALIEMETRTLLGSLGATKEKLAGLQQMFNVLSKKGYLTDSTASALKTFSNIRNLIVHGRKPQNDHAMLQAIDLGIDLLKTIRLIPRETYKVKATGINLYSDQNCKIIRDDVKGVIIETTTPDIQEKYDRIFPTRNPSYYQIDKRVSWEWNLGVSWDNTWYIDNNTGDIKSAWTSSLEFTGRHIEDL